MFDNSAYILSQLPVHSCIRMELAYVGLHVMYKVSRLLGAPDLVTKVICSIILDTAGNSTW